jgi:hypothetical protein
LITETRIYFLKGVKMNTKKSEELLKEKINPQAEELADLTVTDEQAQQSKGGQSSTVGRAQLKTYLCPSS